MSAPEVDEAAERRLEARKWFDKAAEDLRVAGLLAAAAPPAAGSAAFHLQQAAEKLLKGLLVTVSVPFGKTRDLERLAALAAPHYPDMASFLGGIASLTPWAVLGPSSTDTPDSTTSRYRHPRNWSVSPS